MRLNISPATRIKILKAVGLVAGATCFAQGILLMRAEDQLRQLDKIMRENEIKGKIIRRFYEGSDSSLSENIAEEFAFDWLTKDLGA